jgi:type I restriction enzyme M protein
LVLCDQESEIKKALKEAEAALDVKAYGQYPKLTDADIQTLVVDEKWLGALDAAIHGEMDRISQSLTRRVSELARRYEDPMPKQSCTVAASEEKVNGHLERMGFSWR